jgi:hypothetical protein
MTGNTRGGALTPIVSTQTAQKLQSFCKNLNSYKTFKKMAL